MVFLKIDAGRTTVKGILADNNVIGQVAYLVQLMQSEPWADFWNSLGLVLRNFADVGLAATATDEEVWQRCQIEEFSSRTTATTIRRFPLRPSSATPTTQIRCPYSRSGISTSLAATANTKSASWRRFMITFSALTRSGARAVYFCLELCYFGVSFFAGTLFSTKSIIVLHTSSRLTPRK